MSTKNSINNKTGPLTITDSADITKAVLFNVASVTTATTRTLTMDDRDIDFDAVPTTVGTDSGTCTPATGTFSIVGSGSASTSGSGSVVTITSSSSPTMSVGFLAYIEENENNLTGDGTEYVLGTSESFIEIFDVGNDFVIGTGIFTAPSTGKYRFDMCVKISGLTSGHTTMEPYLKTSNHNYRYHDSNPYAMAKSGGIYSYSATILVDMDINDTTSLVVDVSGSTKVVDILGDSAPLVTWFSGNLVG